MQNNISKPVLVALSIYISSIFAANTLGMKLMPFLGGMHLSVAVFSFPFVFITTDVIGEIYGKKMAKNFVLAGVLSILVFMFFSLLSDFFPWSQKSLWLKDGYEKIFGLSFRFSLASIVAFAIAEYQDVFSFFFFRKHTGEKNFWLRSNASNIWSQLIDASVWSLIAYFGVYPFSVIVSIIIPWWIYKVLMGFLYTPLSYLSVKIIKFYENKSYKD